jgi:glycosyltransferase involved in cell wall biosynthesis
MALMENIDGYITNAPTEETISQKWDVFFYNRVSMFDNNLDELREKTGCKIVLDMDDSWYLPTNHLNFRDYIHLNPRIENNLRNADMVTCTHSRLAELIYSFNKNVHIFPNAIPYGQFQFDDTIIESEYTRLFWCGGITHEGDLELLKNPIKRLHQYGNKIQMVIGGYNDDSLISKFLWDKMVSYFTSAGKLNHKIIPGTTPNKYMEMYQHADIMLVPLLKSEWASNKSNLKILEAGTKGIPVICSAVAPYIDDADAPILWVKNKSDWYKHMNSLINDKQKRIEYGTKTKKWCREKYDFGTINAKRQHEFERITGTTTGITTGGTIESICQ